jgi:hypothetical protein
MTCPWRNDTIAHLLDGEPTSAARAAELAEHWKGCSDCAQSLAQARRLDGVLASISGVAVDDATAERLFAAVRQPIPAPAPRLFRRSLAGAALVVLGFGLAWWFLPRAPGARSEERGGDASGKVATSPDPARGARVPNMTENQGVILADRPREPGPRAPRSSPSLSQRHRDELWLALPDQPEVLEDSVWLRRLALLATSRGSPGVQAADLASALMERAASGWIATGDPAGLERIAARVARHAPGSARLVELLRESPLAEQWIQEGMARDSVTRTCAIAVGTQKLDESLRRWAEGDEGRLDQVSRELAHWQERPQRSALLLGLWSDLDRRGGSALGARQNEQRAERWFGPQPAGATPELLLIAQTSRSQPVRRLAVLALAMRRDAGAAAFFVERLGAAAAEERRLAAFALSRLPLDTWRPPHPLTRDQELVLAARLGAGDRDLHAWLERWRLTPEERGFLRSGGFSLEQFDIAAALCRARPDDS